MSRYDIMQYIFEVFDPSLPRLGPGNSESTGKALEMVLPAMNRKPSDGGLSILDLGCGNGAQTLDLAKLLDGIITAIDNHQPFLDELWRRAVKEDVSDKIRPCPGDMNNLKLDKASFDLVWAEGSLYNAGFAQGLEVCHGLLAPGGGLAASELTWLRPHTPDECRKFYDEMYSAMVDIPANLETIKDSGFDVIGHFTLPNEAWWDAFYQPLEKRLAVLRKKYAADSGWMEVLDSFQHEIDINSRYSDYFGYVFYVMQRQ